MAEFDPTSSVETWHPIPSVRGCELSNHYRVRCHETVSGFKYRDGPRLARVYVCKRGHVMFNTRCGSERLHRVIVEVVIGERIPPGKLVRHLDDNKLNNHPSNLRIGTHRQNVRDAMRNGRYRAGEASPLSVLTNEMVLDARKAHGEGEPIPSIARRMGVSYSTIRSVILGRTWAHLLPPKKYTRKARVS
jgi:hypothetical protein